VIDKPFALDLPEARAVADRAEALGLLLSVFHNRRWDADFLALRAELGAGRLGAIHTVESRFDRYRPEVRDRWRERDEPGGGIWNDLGPHLVDQALVLFGRPLGVACDLAVMRAGGQAVDWARFRVHGATASWLKSGLDVQEDQLKAGLAVGGPGWGVDPAPAVRVDGATGRREPAPGPAGDYRAFYDGVAAALTAGGPNPVPPEQALAVMEVLEAGMESARLRAEVSLPQVPGWM